MSDSRPPDSEPSENRPEPDDSERAAQASESSTPAPDSTRLILGFTWRFLVAVALLSTIVYIDDTLAGGVIVEFITTHCATAVSWTLNVMGFESTSHGNEIIYKHHVFKIIAECVGLEVLELYAAAVLAFPVSWRARLRGIAKGLPILFFINFIRMITLVLIGSKSTHALEIGHLYVWPLIVIVVAIGLWLSWAWSTNDETHPLA